MSTLACYSFASGATSAAATFMLAAFDLATIGEEVTDTIHLAGPNPTYPPTAFFESEDNVKYTICSYVWSTSNL